MSTELLTRPGKQRQQETDLRPSPATAEENFNDDPILQAFRPENLTWKNVDWIALVWIAGVHLGCLAAPFYFSWTALGVCLLLHWLTCSLGICLGFHRYLAHRSLQLAWPAKFFVLLCGSVSGEGSPLTWASTHRVHHGRSDQPGDPHSPLEGRWWSHLLWMFTLRSKESHDAIVQKYVPDLSKDRMVQFFERTWFYWMAGVGVALFAIGGLPMLVWGLCVRMVIAYHSTWFVNSATHLWGYRNYETSDDSRNLWWVALFAYGEGWHNNHHAHPRLAPAGHRWWEVDITWWAIRLLRFCRLASNVNANIPAEKSEA